MFGKLSINYDETIRNFTTQTNNYFRRISDQKLIKFTKFSDVVGKFYEVGEYKILPIYHPSPISPKSYQGNVPIFEKLKELNIINI